MGDEEPEEAERPVSITKQGGKTGGDEYDPGAVTAVAAKPSEAAAAQPPPAAQPQYQSQQHADAWNRYYAQTRGYQPYYGAPPPGYSAPPPAHFQHQYQHQYHQYPQHHHHHHQHQQQQYPYPYPHPQQPPPPQQPPQSNPKSVQVQYVPMKSASQQQQLPAARPPPPPASLELKARKIGSEVPPPPAEARPRREAPVSKEVKSPPPKLSKEETERITEAVKAWVTRCLEIGNGHDAEVKKTLQGIVRRHMPKRSEWALVDWNTKPIPHEVNDLIRFDDRKKRREEEPPPPPPTEPPPRRPGRSPSSSSSSRRRTRRKRGRRDTSSSSYSSDYSPVPVAKKKITKVKMIKVVKKKAAKPVFQAPLDQLDARVNRMFRFGKETEKAKAKNLFLPPITTNQPSMQPVFTNDVFEEDQCEPIVGICNDLEKSFTRSAAGLEHDPRIVRPLHVLRESLPYIMKERKKKTDVRIYCYEQFKSIRQDLTVQHIFNSFTTEVYEEHARICLQHGDLGEFNACQAKLRAFHKRPDMIVKSSHVVEFTAYRMMYCCLTKSFTDLALEINELTPELKENPVIHHALSIVTALTPLNVFLFRQAYETAPNMGQLLFDMFLPPPRGLRVQMYIQLCKVYKPVIPYQYLKECLLFKEAMGEGDPKAADPSTLEGFLEYTKAVRKGDEIDTGKSLTRFMEVQVNLDNRKDFNAPSTSVSPSPSPPPF